MRAKSNSAFSVTEALGMYQRLLQRGQTQTLARLSVEARLGDLTPQQRRRVRQALREYQPPAE